MSVFSSLHFCLPNSSAPTEITSDVHPRLPDTIDVTVRIGHANFTISGPTAEVRAVLTEMLNAAMRVTPLARAAEASP